MSLQRSSVLVVDDEPSLRKTLHTSLSVSGFAVEEARNGEEALRMVQRHPFALVLMDVNTPGMGGIDACRQIRAMSPHAGIVMVTVRDLEEDQVRALDAGADDYVTKPLRLPELVAPASLSAASVASTDVNTTAMFSLLSVPSAGDRPGCPVAGVRILSIASDMVFRPSTP